MIQIKIAVNGSKLGTICDDKNPTLLENSLMVRELERLKHELVGQDFKVDSEIRFEGDEE